MRLAGARRGAREGRGAAGACVFAAREAEAALSSYLGSRVVARSTGAGTERDGSPGLRTPSPVLIPRLPPPCPPGLRGGTVAGRGAGYHQPEGDPPPRG